MASGFRAFAHGALALVLGLAASTAAAQSVTGVATYRERLTLPPAAVFEATLEDVSRADGPPVIVARTRIDRPGNSPIAFTLTYDPGKIVPAGRYVVRAKILLDDTLLFTADTDAPAITGGNPRKVSIMLRRATADGQSLEGTEWRPTELDGQPTAEPKMTGEAHLRFESGGRVSGSDGCNRFSGTYIMTGEAITFSKMAGTQMACIRSAGIERAFRNAIANAARATIGSDRLELLDAAGNRVAVFARRTSQPAAAALEGTTWQLVKFQDGADKTLTPDDGSKYTIEFVAGGRLNARVDCNRGNGTWKSTGPNQIALGSLALTRAQCPSGSLHDHIVKQWTSIRSYVIKDGHLFLSLIADGGSYEFAPVK